MALHHLHHRGHQNPTTIIVVSPGQAATTATSPSTLHQLYIVTDLLCYFVLIYAGAVYDKKSIFLSSGLSVTISGSVFVAIYPCLPAM
jgi:hypothetical protein